jgi:hypothetical protein
MVMRRIFIIFGIVFTGFLGCRKAGVSEVTSTSNTEENKLVNASFSITNGVTVKDLIDRFGPPASEHKVNDSSVLDFLFPSSLGLPEGVAGISVWARNGKVYKHNFINGNPSFTADDATTKPPLLVLSSPKSNQSLTLHPLGIGPILDPSKSNAITRAKINLSSEDVLKLSEFTRTNIGSKLHIFLNGKFLSEFYVTEEINTNEIELTFGGGDKMF